MSVLLGSSGATVILGSSGGGVVRRTGGSQALLTAADLSFVGWIRVPTAYGEQYYNGGGLTTRTVGADTHLFTYGDYTDGYPLYEWIVPASPNTTMSSAPYMTLSRNWGDIFDNRRLTGGTPGAVTTGGLRWDADYGGLWWSYGDVYVPVQHDPSIGFTALNDGDGSKTYKGPWRTVTSSQRTRDAFIDVPSDFATAYLSGKRAAIIGGSHSGMSGCAYGASFEALGAINPMTEAADATGTVSDIAIDCHSVISHTQSHKQTRDATNYAICSWNNNSPYDCAGGTTITDGTTDWGGPVSAIGENDTMCAAAWIDLADKHGLLYIAQLVGSPAGYSAPGDASGRAHMWYGDPDGLNQTYKHCCHGQSDPWWGATGPGAHRRYLRGYIYDPADVALAAQGSINAYSLTPDEFMWDDVNADPLSGAGRPGMVQGMTFDAATRRLYVLWRGADTVSIDTKYRPVIAVYEVL